MSEFKIGSLKLWSEACPSWYKFEGAVFVAAENGSLRAERKRAAVLGQDKDPSPCLQGVSSRSLYGGDPVTCPDCDGNGLAPGAYGVLAQGIAVSMGGVLLQCPTCKGRGTVCDKCGGSGEEQAT